MPNFATKYTREQREAIIAAYVDQGMTAPQVVEAAASGELTGEPFEVPKDTVYHFGTEASQERQEERFVRLVETEPEEAAQELLREQLLLLRAEHKRVQAEARKGKPLDIARSKQIADCLRSYMSLGSKSRPRSVAPQGNTRRSPATQQWFDDLERRARKLDQERRARELDQVREDLEASHSDGVADDERLARNAALQKRLDTLHEPAPDAVPAHATDGGADPSSPSRS